MKTAANGYSKYLLFRYDIEIIFILVFFGFIALIIWVVVPESADNAARIELHNMGRLNHIMHTF